MICVNKSVTLVSSDGAAETVIDARDVPNLSENVAIIANNVKFGAAGQGFTVTNVLTLVDQENPTFGITTGSDQVTIEGNRVLSCTVKARSRLSGYRRVISQSTRTPF